MTEAILSEVVCGGACPVDVALLSGYMALATSNRSWVDSTAERLNQAAEQMDTLRPALFGGLCGLGWAVEHLSRELNAMFPPEEEGADEDGSDGITAIIDKAMLGILRTPRWPGTFDLIGGLAGFGVYFLERCPAESAWSGIDLVLDRLEEYSVPQEAGIAWFTQPGLLAPHQAQRSPDGHFDLGVAHGVPGVIGFLAQASAAGSARARDMLHDAVLWLISQQRKPGARSRFASLAGTDSDTRMTWCYGDLGILAVITRAADYIQSDEVNEFAGSLLEDCLRRPADEGIIDAPLCHGAAGIAHIWNRIYQRSGDQRCRQAAWTWFGKTLDMRHPGSGVAGFPSFVKAGADQPGRWQSVPALLDGAIGIALSFLAATSAVEPRWDRMLLLSANG